MTSKVEMVSVVIPTLNEAGNILEAVTTIEKEVAYPHEIIVVDGNSTDGTMEIVKGNIIVMVDGDGTYEVRHINRLVERMLQKDADMVLATRMFDPQKAMGLTNFIGNKLITFVYDFFYSQMLSDTQSGFRAIAHDKIDNVPLKEGDMAFATEMLVQFAKVGYNMVEIPTIYKSRQYGKTKLKPFKSGIEIFSTIFKGFLDADTVRTCQKHWRENRLKR
jgi:glycosyltransferase involved in cell wall biosynthesis